MSTGCVTVPTSTTDERLANYTPKITAQDLQFDPNSTPIAQLYKSELEENWDKSAANLI